MHLLIISRSVSVVWIRGCRKYVTRMLSDLLQNLLLDVLMNMAKGVKLKVGGGADAKGRNGRHSYVRRSGEVVGIIKLVKLWHAIGHSVRETLI
jgi:hypothetical protein